MKNNFITIFDFSFSYFASLPLLWSAFIIVYLISLTRKVRFQINALPIRHTFEKADVRTSWFNSLIQEKLFSALISGTLVLGLFATVLALIVNVDHFVKFITNKDNKELDLLLQSIPNIIYSLQPLGVAVLCYLLNSIIVLVCLNNLKKQFFKTHLSGQSNKTTELNKYKEFLDDFKTEIGNLIKASESISKQTLASVKAIENIQQKQSDVLIKLNACVEQFNQSISNFENVYSENNDLLFQAVTKQEKLLNKQMQEFSTTSPIGKAIIEANKNGVLFSEFLSKFEVFLNKLSDEYSSTSKINNANHERLTGIADNMSDFLKNFVELYTSYNENLTKTMRIKVTGNVTNSIEHLIKNNLQQNTEEPLNKVYSDTTIIEQLATTLTSNISGDIKDEIDNTTNKILDSLSKQQAAMIRDLRIEIENTLSSKSKPLSTNSSEKSSNSKNRQTKSFWKFNWFK